MAGAIEKYNSIKGPYKSSGFCPSCQKEYTIRTFAQASHFACRHCQKLINLRKQKAEELRLEPPYRNPFLELGQRGSFDGNDFEVVGIINYKEERERFYWFEYTLFNPFEGYRTLTHVNGHWNLFERTMDFPRDVSANRDPNIIKRNGLEFKLYHRSRAELVWASGEFKWNIGEQPRPRCVEYTCPPYLLTKEQGTSDVTWFLGKYVTHDELKKAFQLQKSIPSKIGIAPNQPFTLSFDLAKLYTISFLAIIVYMFSLFALGPKQVEVYANKFYPERVDSLSGSALRPIITESFTVDPTMLTTGNLQIDLFAEVDNGWAESQVTLVNDDTDEEYETEIGVEYYYGYTGGENWHEGSQSADRFVSEASPGRYHMVVVPFMDETKAPVALTLKVTSNVFMWSNFWIGFLALLIFPVSAYFYTQNFEKRRWMDSEFSPYDD